MIALQTMPPLHIGHCCQCPSEVVGGERYFVAVSDGIGQITCANCVKRLMEE